MNRLSLACVTCVCLMSVVACSKPSENKKPSTEKRPSNIISTQVKVGTLPHEINAVGHAEALQTVEVRPQITAQIAQIHFKEGDQVTAGQLLFSLDADKAKSQASRSLALTEKSKAEYAEAVRNLKRTEELAEAGFVSPSAVDTARAKMGSLQAQVAAAKADESANAVELAYTQIKAPITGRTGALSLKRGSLAQANSSTPLVTISQTDPIQINFNINQTDLPAVLAAQSQGPVQVTSKLPNGELRIGVLLFLDNTVDKASGTLLAKAKFANQDQQLWPGLSSSVSIQLAPQTGLIVPLQAVQTGPEQRFVYLIDSHQQVKVQTVTLINSQNDLALIEGVPAGTRIVKEGGQNLRPGDKVIEAKHPADPALNTSHVASAVSGSVQGSK